MQARGLFGEFARVIVGQFQPLLVEGMPGRMTWGCLMRLPARLVPLLDRAYQAQLTRERPDISDEECRRAMVEAGARWHIFHVVHRLPDALKGDRQRGPTTLRQQVTAWLTAFAELSEEFGGMPALGASARLAVGRLGSVWPAEALDLPRYPAFSRER